MQKESTPRRISPCRRRLQIMRTVLITLLMTLCTVWALLQVSSTARLQYRSISLAICRQFNNTDSFCQQRDQSLRLGVTPLHHLVEWPFQALLPLAADLSNFIGLGVNVVDDHGQTPLHYAARNGVAVVVLALLKRGARTDVRDVDQRTPLDVLMSQGKHDRSVFLAARYLEMASINPFPPAPPFSMSMSSLLARFGIKSAAPVDSLSSVSLPRYDAVQRIPFSELSVERFIRDFVRTRTPVVMTNALAAFNLTGWRSADMAKACGSSLFPTVRFKPGATQWAKLQISDTQSNLSSFMAQNFGRTPAGTRSEATQSGLRIFDSAFVQRCADLGNVLTLPQHVASDLRRTWDYDHPDATIMQPSMFACPSGSKSGLHIDSGDTAFWMVVLEGKKTFRFVNRQHMHFLKSENWYDTYYHNFLLDLYDDAANAGPNGASWQRRWNAETLAMVGGWEANIERGDMIYVPPGSPHQECTVITLADTISFSSNFVEPELSQHTLKYCCMHPQSENCAKVLLPLAGRSDIEYLSVEYRKRIASKATGPHQTVSVLSYLEQMKIAEQVFGLQSLAPEQRHQFGKVDDAALYDACKRSGFP